MSELKQKAPSQKDRSYFHTQSNISISKPTRTIFGFPLYWLACVPLSAIIVIVWNTAATAQNFEAPANIDELRVVLDSIFLLFCSVLVIFMNAGFGMLETGFLSPKKCG